MTNRNVWSRRELLAGTECNRQSFEQLELDWIEAPFAMGPDSVRLRESIRLRVAAGELFWGLPRFARIVDNAWADVIRPPS